MIYDIKANANGHGVWGCKAPQAHMRSKPGAVVSKAKPRQGTEQGGMLSADLSTVYSGDWGERAREREGGHGTQKKGKGGYIEIREEE